MDILHTKKIAELLERELGVILPKTDEDLKKLGDVLDKAGVMILEGTDLIRDMDKIVESVPEQWQAIVKVALEVLGSANRTIWRVSNAVQTWDDGVVVNVGKDGKFGESAVSGTITITPLKKV